MVALRSFQEGTQKGATTRNQNDNEATKAMDRCGGRCHSGQLQTMCAEAVEVQLKCWTRHVSLYCAVSRQGHVRCNLHHNNYHRLAGGTSWLSVACDGLAPHVHYAMQLLSVAEHRRHASPCAHSRRNGTTSNVAPADNGAKPAHTHQACRNSDTLKLPGRAQPTAYCFITINTASKQKPALSI